MFKETTTRSRQLGLVAYVLVDQAGLALLPLSSVVVLVLVCRYVKD
jgi:hypothetical protein